MTTRLIGIDADTADQLVLTILKETYEGIQSEIDELSSKRRLRPHEEQDLKDSLHNLHCLEGVIRYFSIPSEFQNWLDEVTETE
jgi:hypothetical protein